MRCQGTVVGFLSHVKRDASLPIIPQPPPTQPQASFAGTVDEYIASRPTPAEKELADVMLKTPVKQCGVCRKPNGFTLATCNQCGHSLKDTPISHTPNVFTSFMFGIERAGFPLTISIRHQDASVLVFDDLLALSPMHVNAIPTTHFIRDWRYLMRRPAEGIRVIDELLEACHRVAETQFLYADNSGAAPSSWASKLLKQDTDEPFNPRLHVACGFNYPPSQSQLHIQYIFPNVTPFQHAQFLSGVHFTEGRFFPFGYVRRCLELLCTNQQLTQQSTTPSASPSPASIPIDLLEDSASVDDIIQYFKQQHAHDYDAVHAQFLKRFASLSGKYSAWQEEWFEGMTVPTQPGQGLFVPSSGAAGSGQQQTTAVRLSDVAAQDKLALQNYGRPYDANGKPTGSYYAFRKSATELDVW